MQKELNKSLISVPSQTVPESNIGKIHWKGGLKCCLTIQLSAAGAGWGLGQIKPGNYLELDLHTGALWC